MMTAATREPRSRTFVVILCSILAVLFVADTTLAGPVAEMHRTLAGFDDTRALAMRGLKQAQDLKTVALYGRGFGLDMPESVPEDMLIEGLWLFDYLEAMDVTSMSMVSYAAAKEHPNLAEELAVFQAYAGGAAKRSLAYYDKTAEALAAARKKVNTAAAAKVAFKIEKLPAAPVTKGPEEGIAGDGFRVGWSVQVAPPPTSDRARHSKQHGYGPQRPFEMAAKFGLDYIRPSDKDLFGWRAGGGKFDFTALDVALGRFKKYSLSMWLPVPAQAEFAEHVQAVIRHVRKSGVEIITVEIVERKVPQLPDDRKRAWLKEHARAPAEPKTKAQKRLAAVDQIRWREQEHVEHFRPMVKAIRAAAPDLPVVLHKRPPHESSVVREGWNDELLARELGVVPYGRSEEHIWDELRRAYSKTHFSAAQTHTGSGNAFAQYAFSGYMHGSLTIYSGMYPILRGFYWADSFMYPDLRPRWSTLFDWRRFHERAQSMAPEMRFTIPRPQTAVLWSHTSDLYQSFTTDIAGGSYGFRTGPANYHRVGSIGWDRLLYMINMPHDYVTESQAIAGALSRYELVVLPAAQALPKKVVEAVREYVRAGGNVIATSSVALADENMEETAAGQLADVFGADLDELIGAATIAGSALKSPSYNEALHGHWSGNKVFDKPAVQAKRTVYCTFKARKGAEVLAQFTDGRPAIVLNRFGKGQATVIGYPVGREFFTSDIYHMHYGHNWADWPNGSLFQQGVCLYIESLLDKMNIRPAAVVSHEFAPRAIGQDAGWPVWQWTRKGGGYRDFVWKTSVLPDTTARHRRGNGRPRSVEVAIRKRKGNPNVYLTVFNREGAYGFDPGVIHAAAASKTIKIEVRRDDGRAAYDLAVRCAVPLKIEAGSTTFHTTIEMSMGRMIVMATGEDDKIRLYAGRRKRGGTDAALRKRVIAAAAGAKKTPQTVVIAKADVAAYIKQRVAKGITISCESPMWLPSARKLAAAIKAKYGVDARITRNSPRIAGNFNGLGTWRSEGYTLIEQPDIILGNRTESHYVAALCMSEQARPGRSNDGKHDAPLPIVTTHSFPGPGRCAVALTRPYGKRQQRGGEGLFYEVPAKSRSVVIGGSDAAGVAAGVAAVIKLLK